MHVHIEVWEAPSECPASPVGQDLGGTWYEDNPGWKSGIQGTLALALAAHLPQFPTPLPIARTPPQNHEISSAHGAQAARGLQAPSDSNCSLGETPCSSLDQNSSRDLFS